MIKINWDEVKIYIVFKEDTIIDDYYFKWYGLKSEYKNLKDFLNNVTYYALKYYVGDYIDQPIDLKNKASFCIVNDLGKVLSRGFLLEQKLKLLKPKKSKHYKYRNGPVEGIHRYSGMGWRHQHTFQETKEMLYLRDSDEDVKSYKIKIRNKRCGLPNAWDDLLKSSYGNNNWKRYRNKQWKPKS